MHKIVKLTKTYVTLSLSDIASFVELNSFEKAEYFIVKMVHEGMINASISEVDGGMVCGL